MANSNSTQDLIKGTLQRCGERSDGTSPYHQLALKYINRVYKSILKGNSEFAPELRQAWSWARQTRSFIIPGDYGQGTVSLTQGSTAGVLSVAPTFSLEGYFFRVIDRPTFYRIASHTANTTSITLDLAYIEDTASSLSFLALPLQVDLGPNILRIVGPLRIYLNRVLEFKETATDMGEISFSDPLPFWENYPLQLIQNDTPSKCTIISRSDTEFVVQFNKYTTNPLRADFDFIPRVNDLVDSSTDVPLIPNDDRDVLETGAAYYLILDKNDKEKAQTYFQLTAAKIASMALLEQSIQKFSSRAYGELIPRLDDSAIPYWVIMK